MTELIQGNCLEVMDCIKENSIDTCITDPPYGLKFMGKGWDHGIPGVRFWEEILRVLKPGATLLAFGGTRTHHRLMVAIEDAGFEIRDCLMWLYGTGFPKSYDISKGIDKAAGTDSAKLWDGWGTALKPAWEPIIVAMKPREGTFVNNALKHGVAGLNIDGSRIETEDNLGGGAYAKEGTNRDDGWGMQRTGGAGNYEQPSGRWPSNLLLDEQAALLLDEHSGGASRFFYCAKASQKERGEANNHPTVKPVALMRYLCKLTKTPAGGTVIDPFIGSGSTGIACLLEGREFIGIELDENYFNIAKQRIENHTVPLGI